MNGFGGRRCWRPLAGALVALAAQAWADPAAPSFENGGWWLDVDGCALVENMGLDTVARIHDQDGRVVAHAGTWLGRAGRYLVLADAGQRVELRSTGGALESDSVRVHPCPPAAWGRGGAALARALDHRLRNYLGIGADPAGPAADFDEAVDVLAADRDRWLHGLARFERGTWLRSAGRSAAAEADLVEAARVFEASGDADAAGRALNMLGLLAWRDGRLDQARDHYLQALDQALAANETHQVATLDNNLGLLAADAGRDDQAEWRFQLALEAFQGDIDLRRAIAGSEAEALAGRVTPPADLAAALNTLNNLALVHRRRGQTDLAERYWRNYLTFDGHLAELGAAAEARMNLGAMLVETGRLDEALVLLGDALSVFQRTGSAMWQAFARIELAMLYFRLGDMDGARDQAAAAAALGIEGSRDAQVVGQALGRLALADGELDAAEAHFRRALADLPPDEGLILGQLIHIDLARVALARERLDDAARRLTGVLLALDGAGQRGRAAEARSLFGEVHLRRGEWSRARILLEQALDSQQAIGDVFGELETLERLGRLESAEGRTEAMLRHDQQALARVAEVLARPLPPLRRAGFLSLVRSIHQRSIDALLELDRLDPAWAVAAQARGTHIFEQRRTHARRIDSAQRKALLDRHAELVARLAALRAASAPGNGGINALRRSLDRVEVELQRLDQAVLQASPFAALDALQGRLRTSQRILAFDRLPGLSLGWLIGPERVEVRRLAIDGGTVAQIDGLLAALRHPRNAPGRILRWIRELHARLLAPFEPALDGAGELLIVPDGELHSLPFGLLLALGGDDPPPVVSRLLTTAASDVAAPADRSDRVARRVLVLADPAPGAPGPVPGELPARSLIGRLLTGDAGWSLPGTRAEARAIAETAAETIADPVAIELRTGALASRDFLLSGQLAGYDIVHLATHGLVDLEYPQLSALLLRAPDAAGPAFVRPHEIAQLDLDSELVVLSACDTGLGKTYAGSGAFSLARPFLVAGARHVLATLWKIDDARTARFMARFYRFLLVERLAPADALARTQAWMRDQPGLAHPYYWAGFVLTARELATTAAEGDSKLSTRISSPITRSSALPVTR